ncbi:MAG: GMC family oxidoreductase [Okeania sp. SIO3B3]|nr:GMC family oxidoreductase [Okeania sp. SIO3B3]
MIISLEEAKNAIFPVAVIGAGPVGISLALALEEQGIDCLLIESGGDAYSEPVQALSDAAKYDPDHHAPMADATRRQLGGASVTWGGRCIPFDPIDFESRDYVPDAHWPVGYDEIWPYHRKACEYALCGSDLFAVHDALKSDQDGVVPGLVNDEDVCTRLERWSLPTNFGKEHSQRLANSKHIKLLKNTTVVGIRLSADGTSVQRLDAKTSGGTESFSLTAGHVALACGGLESTRLLLASNDVQPQGIGNHSGHLGRHYMGHISGKIARVKFNTEPGKTIYGFEADADKVYTRRRFTFPAQSQRKHQLFNTAIWLDNPPIYDPAHGNAILSFAYIALTFPIVCKLLAPDAIRKAAVGEGHKYSYLAHLKNLFADLPGLIKFVFSFGINRYLVRRKIPGFFLPNKSNVYELHYHAEQCPNGDSTALLTQNTDALGMPRLDINLQYTKPDVDSVLRCHTVLDERLRAQGVGQLEYKYDDLPAAILKQATDGFHQMGTTRMSQKPEDGVVDANLKVHGVDNLYVCASSSFPSSGQANPTLTTMAFAIRLAQHLKQTTT